MSYLLPSGLVPPAGDGRKVCYCDLKEYSENAVQSAQRMEDSNLP